MEPAPYDEQRLVNFDALTNLISLRHITLCGRVLSTALEQSEFGCALASTLLEELTYITHDDTG